MANTIGQGQITIMDYNDGLTLTSLIDINKPLIFQYNANTGTLSPTLSGTNTMRLTPRVFVSGLTEDQISNIQYVDGASSYWSYRIGSDSDTWETLDSNYESEGTDKVLTIKQNRLASAEQVTYRFRCAYYVEATGFTVDTQNYVTLSRVRNGNGAIIANAYCPNGNTFKNATPATLTVKAELLRGDEVDASVTRYQWQKFDGSTSAYVDLTDTAGKVTGSSTNTLTLYASYVTSYMMVRCVITDTTDGATTNYESAGVSIIDTQDPYKVELIGSSQYLKNGIGSVTIEAHVYQANLELDDLSSFSFVWSKIDKDGNTSALTETSNTLTIDGDDVDVKATFVCTVKK